MAYREEHADEIKAKMKAYYQTPEYKAKKKAYQQNYTPDYKKKAKTAEKNVREILKKHNLSHLRKPMILDGISLDTELKKRGLETLA